MIGNKLVSENLLTVEDYFWRIKFFNKNKMNAHNGKD